MRSIKGVPTKTMTAVIGDTPVQRADAVPIGSFSDLVREVAQLSYLNKDHLLFFRGQARDHRNKAGSSTLYPSIYRGERVSREQLDLSFSILDSSASRLCALFKSEELSGHRDVRRRRYVQWSILQHYEVCSTPLLDLTHSLLVACSFAFLATKEGDPFVFVFGLPYVTNRISVNSEHDIVNVRLLSICPPAALRPYFQEGYLAGTDEVRAEFDSKSELDLNNRLIAKFRLVNGRKRFWDGGVRAYGLGVLYPDDDRVRHLCESIKTDVGTGVSAGLVGEFLQKWTTLESRVMDRARRLSEKRQVYSMRTALDLLRQREALAPEIVASLHQVRRTRNEVVHRSETVSTHEVARTTATMRGLILDLEDSSTGATQQGL